MRLTTSSSRILKSLSSAAPATTYAAKSFSSAIAPTPSIASLVLPSALTFSYMQEETSTKNFSLFNSTAERPLIIEAATPERSATPARIKRHDVVDSRSIAQRIQDAQLREEAPRQSRSLRA